MCDVCSVEGAKFNEGQSKCIIGDESDDNSDGGGLCVGAIIGEFLSTASPSNAVEIRCFEETSEDYICS